MSGVVQSCKKGSMLEGVTGFYIQKMIKRLSGKISAWSLVGGLTDVIDFGVHIGVTFAPIVIIKSLVHTIQLVFVFVIVFEISIKTIQVLEKRSSYARANFNMCRRSSLTIFNKKLDLLRPNAKTIRINYFERPVNEVSKPKELGQNFPGYKFNGQFKQFWPKPVFSC